MAKPASPWIQVAAFSDIPGGEAKAVRLEVVAALRCLTSMDGSTPPTTSAPIAFTFGGAVLGRRIHRMRWWPSVPRRTHLHSSG
jgi:hypothetical protein